MRPKRRGLFFPLNFWAIEVLSLKVRNTEIFKKENYISGHKMLLFENQVLKEISERKFKSKKKIRICRKASMK